MKECRNCAATNPDSARVCSECGRELVSSATKGPSLGGIMGESLDPDALMKSLCDRGISLEKSRQADVMFVLDCTGSMQGEIDAIREAITGFADTIKSDGVRVRVGLIAFRDRLIGEEHQVLLFGGHPFTDDPAAFRREVSKLKAKGGGDAPESSLDAVAVAVRQSFRSDANKVLVLVTDAPPHIPDKETRDIEKVVDAIRSAEIAQIYLVIRTEDRASHIYLRLLEHTRGLAFDLGKGDDFRQRAEHFKRTLMQLGKTISSATT